MENILGYVIVFVLGVVVGAVGLAALSVMSYSGSLSNREFGEERHKEPPKFDPY